MLNEYQNRVILFGGFVIFFVKNSIEISINYLENNYHYMRQKHINVNNFIQ